ncbi:MAG TPA: hypothetical protein VGM13_12780 [Thermoanaerobaculia bacterium]|jgi:hypothetical protein
MATAKKKPGRPRVHGDDVKRITMVIEAEEYAQLAAFKRHRSAAENADLSFARVLLDALSESKAYRDWRRARR